MPVLLLLMPVLMLCYILNYLDRSNIGMAKLEFLHDLVVRSFRCVSAMHHFQATNQSSLLGERGDLVLLVVHGSLRMKYGVGQLNSFSRPRDVLPDKFTFMWTRTTRRSPPLYAMTFGLFVRRARVSRGPYRGQTDPLYPQIPRLSANWG